MVIACSTNLIVYLGFIEMVIPKIDLKIAFLQSRAAAKHIYIISPKQFLNKFFY